MRRYLTAIHFEQTLDNMMGALMPLMAKNALQQYPNITEEQRGAIGDVVRDAMREDFTPKMIERMIPVYAQAFSESELEAMVAFYESPAGQSIVRKTPSLAPQERGDRPWELVPEIQKGVMRRLCAKDRLLRREARAPAEGRFVLTATSSSPGRR